MGYTIFRPDECDFQAAQRGDQRRSLVPLSGAMHTMRANIWRLPAGARGTRHLEHVQEEMFVVLEGTATLLVGDPPERVELPCGSVAIVETDANEVRAELTEDIAAERTATIRKPRSSTGTSVIMKMGKIKSLAAMPEPGRTCGKGIFKGWCW